ncbi:MAG: putative transporter, permease component [Chloroflexota bacterium]|nr:putative transporter, permease component [Chloroflexota bacterium]
MSRWRSVWLVARREMVERGRSRGFILSVAFTTVLVVGSFVVPTLLFGDDDATKIGVVQPEPPGLSLAITTSASQLDQEIEIVPFADEAAGDAALADESVEGVAIVPADLSGPGEIRFDKEPDQFVTQLVTASVVALRTQAVVTEAGVPPADMLAAQQAPTVHALDPQTEMDDAQFLFANIGAVLILVGIFSFGFTVLTGVVEEKQSRVVEVVLSTVRPRDLLMGKVMGIGVLGLIQLAVFVAAALAAAVLTDRFGLPATTPSAVLLLVVWFVLGYALYSTALGFLGALASRMEEASNASTPVTMVAMISYFVAIFAVINDPSGPVAVVATYLPPSAPFVVPLRAAFDAIGPIEILLSIAVTVAGIWVLFNVGARVYAGAVLQTAGRMKIRDAWRSAGE